MTGEMLGIICVLAAGWGLREWWHRAQMQKLSADCGKHEKEVETLRNEGRHTAANLQMILSSMLDGLLVVDARGTIRVANTSVIQRFQLPADVVGKSLETFPDATCAEVILGALEARQNQEREVRVRQDDGEFVAMVNASFVEDVGGGFAVVATFRDNTRLNQLEDVRRQFVANVSHELRTPLAVFQGYVENLMFQPEMSETERMDAYRILEKHSMRMNALVEDLLILARLEAGSSWLSLEEVDMREFLGDIKRDWLPRAAAKSVELVLEVESDLPLIFMDPRRMEQVFNNLLDNALKYTPAAGIISIRAVSSGEMIEMRVQDSGPGILSADLPHIFERFYRADKSRSAPGGTGLGLSIVKHIIQSHGGTVEAQSALRKGTTIVFRLPIITPTTGDA